MGNLPNLFIIGAPKCGTTSLATWLDTHPNVFMSPIKEPLFFSHDIVANNWSHGHHAYLNLFEKAKPEHRIIGEASTHYLFSKVAVPTIERSFTKTKFIVMLRNPIEMAPSLHEQNIRSYKEKTLDFSEAWNFSPKCRDNTSSNSRHNCSILRDYQSWCLIGEQLERLLTLVPSNRVHITVLDDVKVNPRIEYLKVLNFLQIPDDNRQSFRAHNSAREWRSPLLGLLIRSLAKSIAWGKHVKGFFPARSFGIVDRLQSFNTRPSLREPLAPDTLAELENYFIQDVKKLEKILRRDLNHWLLHPDIHQ